MSDSEDSGDDDNYSEDEYEYEGYTEPTFTESIENERTRVNEGWSSNLVFDHFEIMPTSARKTTFKRDNCVITIENNDTYLEIMGFYCYDDLGDGTLRGRGKGIKHNLKFNTRNQY